MFVLFFTFLYRILGQKYVSGERWKTYRKLANSRESVLDFTVMHLSG